MKRLTIAAFVLAFAFMAAGAQAEEVTIEATGTNERGETIKVPIKAQIRTISDEAKEKRDDLKSEIETRKQELETKRVAAKAEARANASTTIAEKMEKTIAKSEQKLKKELTRFRQIQDKIEARIEKLESLGANASTSRALLAVAEDKLSLAEISIEAISEVSVSSEDPRSSFDAIKTAVRKAQDDLRAGHRALQAVLPSMKGLQASVSRSATSTKAAATE